MFITCIEKAYIFVHNLKKGTNICDRCTVQYFYSIGKILLAIEKKNKKCH